MIAQDQATRGSSQFQPGQLVSLRIPRKNRITGGVRRILCKVASMPFPDRYQLGTIYGLLTAHYPRCELQAVAESLRYQFISYDGVERTKHSLSTIVLLDHVNRCGISQNNQGISLTYSPERFVVSKSFPLC